MGRNILFEFLKQNIARLDALEIIVLGREKNETPLATRMKEIVLDDGTDYLSNTSGLSRNAIEQWCGEKLQCVEIDLKQEGLIITDNGLEILKRAPIDFFTHSAAVTDFRDKPHVIERLQTVNVRGTEQVLELAQSLHVREFVYVSTAYASGMKAGLVPPDLRDFEQTFRNPYERSKLQVEVCARFCAQRAFWHSLCAPLHYLRTTHGTDTWQCLQIRCVLRLGSIYVVQQTNAVGRMARQIC